MNNIYFIKVKNNDKEWAELYRKFKKAKRRYDNLVKKNKFVFMQVINKDNNYCEVDYINGFAMFFNPNDLRFLYVFCRFFFDPTITMSIFLGS